MTFSNQYKGFFESSSQLSTRLVQSHSTNPPSHASGRMIFIKLKTHHCMPCLKFFSIPLFLEKSALKAYKIISNMVPAPSSSELHFYTLLLSSMELISVPQCSMLSLPLSRYGLMFVSPLTQIHILKSCCCCCY